ncbi:MAG: VF530 family protein [Methylococcaceae bacterium]|nr:VF530 family protein [Methylococcaceae bacterium]
MNQLNKQRNQGSMHGVTLKMVVTVLVEEYGWEQLGQRIKINCFISNPSINSSLKFLRKNLWAREKVEELFLRIQWKKRKT